MSVKDVAFSVVQFLAYSNLYLAVGAASVAYVACLVFGDIYWEPILIAFSGTLFIYNLNRITDFGEDIINYPERLEFFSKFGKFFLY
jgi:hypothetical protein